MSEDRFLKGSKLSKLLAGRERPWRRFTLEVVREGGPERLDIGVRTLTAQEQEEAHAEAVKWLVSTGGWMREDLVGDTGDAVVVLETMVQTLARALVDPDKPSEPFAASAAELRKCFDVDEIRACFDEFSAWSLERSPLRYAKSIAEIREVAEALGKGRMGPTALMRFDATSLRSIITELVAQRATQTKPSSSATSSPIASPDDSSTDSPTHPHTMTVED